MTANPDTEGPVKSLRLVTPGGDIIPGIFAALAALLLLGMLRNPPSTLLTAAVDVLLLGAFAVPAYVLFTSGRRSGLFVSDESVVYRALGGVKQSWRRDQVSEIMAISGGARVIGPGGALLREYRYRYWKTEQVARFARAAGLAPPTALERAASSADMQPGEPGQT